MADPDDPAPVPDPGPRPSAFVFPFAEAATAASAIEAMIEEIQDMVDTHEGEIDAATVNFQGDAATNFLTRFDDDMADLRTLKSDLVTEQTELDTAITTAMDRKAARDAAIGAWDTANDDYTAYQRALADR